MTRIGPGTLCASSFDTSATRPVQDEVMAAGADAEEEALMLLGDGPARRRLLDRASATPVLTATVSGHRIAFALSDGGLQVSRFRESCRFGPA